MSQNFYLILNIDIKNVVEVWKSGSSGTTPAKQAWGPEFKP
jgi:hypothetical protein